MDFNKNRRNRIYEGREKVLFEGPEPNTIVQFFKDDAAVDSTKKTGIISGKGVLNNRISEYLMKKLNSIGVPTHFMRRLNMREQLVREVEIIPIIVMVRNTAAGSLAKRLDIPEGTTLPRPILEFYYKKEDLSYPIVTEDHITAFGWASPYEVEEIMSQTMRVNDYLTGLFHGIGLRLVDFKIEYGRYFDGEDHRIILADEISPDNCRLWDLKTNEKMDKDRFAQELGGVEKAYQEVARRLGLLIEEMGSTTKNETNLTTIKERVEK